MTTTQNPAPVTLNLVAKSTYTLEIQVVDGQFRVFQTLPDGSPLGEITMPDATQIVVTLAPGEGTPSGLVSPSSS